MNPASIRTGRSPYALSSTTMTYPPANRLPIDCSPVGDKLPTIRGPGPPSSSAVGEGFSWTRLNNSHCLAAGLTEIFQVHHVGKNIDLPLQRENRLALPIGPLPPTC